MPQQSSPDLVALTQALLDAARAAGAEAADARAVAASATTVDVRGGALEQAETAESTDIGLRVFLGQRAATVSASDTSARTIEEMAMRAVAMAGEAPEDPFCGLADASALATDWDVDALDLMDGTAQPTPDALQEDATRVEAAALAVDGVSQVPSASAGYSTTRIHAAMSNGFSGGYGRTNRWISCGAIAGSGTGMQRDFDGDSRLHQSDLRSPEEIGATAGQRAVAQLGAQKPPTGTFPVLYDERIAGSLIAHLLSAINGQAIARGASFLRDAMGTQVLPEALSLIEDPHRARAAGSRPFDAEGLPTKRRAIVENGLLGGWILDLATSRKLGLPATGNAARSTGGPPSPTSWNVALTQGADSREDLMHQMGTGLLVTSMIGSTINPNTGDYSRGAFGFWVENGEISYPVSECTIAGNLRDMLASIVPANDARTHLSSVVPSLLVPSMTLAGA